MNKCISRICAAMIVFCLSVLCAAAVFGENPDSTGADPSKEVAAVILHTNDTHCGYEDNIGFDGLVLYKKELEQMYEHVFLVDGGDAIQGSAIGVISKGEALIRMMNAAGVDVATLGNHEFDFGMETLNDCAELFNGTYVCVNFCTSDGKPVFAPGTILDAGELQIGILGVVTPDTYIKTSIKNILDETGQPMYDFLADADGNSLCLALQDNADELRRKGADVIILLSHLGDEESTSIQYQTKNVLAKLSGIDIVLDGHSHVQYTRTLKDKDGKDIPVVQNGMLFENIGQLTIYKDGHLEAMLLDEIPDSDTISTLTVERKGKTRFVDAEMHALQNEIAQSYTGILDQKIGELSFDMIVDNDQDISNRMQENALCELVADAYRSAGHSDIGFVMAASVRGDLLKGDLTYRSVLGLLPYSNAIKTVSVSGQMLKDILEYATRNLPKPAATFPQVSGLTFTVDLSKESGARLDEKGEFTHVEGPYRVSEIKVGGKDLDLSAEYTLTTSEYVINGGDGFTTFHEADFVNDTMKVDNMVVKEYIENELGGVIPDRYRNPLGRMRIITP